MASAIAKDPSVTFVRGWVTCLLFGVLAALSVWYFFLAGPGFHLYDNAKSMSLEASVYIRLGLFAAIILVICVLVLGLFSFDRVKGERKKPPMFPHWKWVNPLALGAWTLFGFGHFIITPAVLSLASATTPPGMWRVYLDNTILNGGHEEVPVDPWFADSMVFDPRVPFDDEYIFAVTDAGGNAVFVSFSFRVLFEDQDGLRQFVSERARHMGIGMTQAEQKAAFVRLFREEFPDLTAEIEEVVRIIDSGHPADQVSLNRLFSVMFEDKLKAAYAFGAGSIQLSKADLVTNLYQ